MITIYLKNMSGISGEVSRRRNDASFDFYSFLCLPQADVDDYINFHHRFAFASST